MSAHDRIEWQEDRTPVSSRFGDIYFDIQNGLEEAKYVFLEANGLYEIFRTEKNLITVGELGFGTGLNFFATAQAFLDLNSNARLHYTSCEKYPLSPEAIRRAIGAWPELSGIVEEFLKSYFRMPQGFLCFEMAGGRIRLQIYFGDVKDYLNDLEGVVDAWYLDGFSPKKNPEMWEDQVIRGIAAHSCRSSSFATFSSAGYIRRQLESAGAKVLKRPGFGKKREMCFGRFEALEAKRTIPPLERVGLIGSGIAASQLADSFDKRRISYEIIEARSSPASGSSGNALALVMPFLSGAETRVRFSASAFSFQRSRYLQTPYFHQTKVRQFLREDKRSKQLKRSIERMPWPEEFFQSNEAEGIYSRAGILEARKFLSEFWSARRSRIRLNFSVRDILQSGSEWLLLGDGNKIGPYSHIVFANSYGAPSLCKDMKSEFSMTRGQIAMLKTKNSTAETLVFGKYLSPTIDGLQVLGGTYRNEFLNEEVRHEENLELLEAFEKEFAYRPEFLSSRAGIRFARRSNWPLCTSSGSKAYLFGFGSRGFSESALCAEHVASALCGELSPLTAHSRQKLSDI